jgi:hypothetical protein
MSGILSGRSLALRQSGWRPTRRSAVIGGLLVGGVVANVAILTRPEGVLLFSDAAAWHYIDYGHLYALAERSLLGIYAFHYAPVVAWAMYPFTVLSWEVYLAIFIALQLAAVALLTGRWWPVYVVAFPMVLMEILNGNIHIFMAVAIWLGITRWPATWSLLFLTKVTPGVGVLWYAGRREWRNLAIALGTTAALAVAGTLIAPDQWAEWVRSLVISTGQQLPSPFPPLLIRLPLAAALAVYAGRSSRAWLIPMACLFAMPTIWPQSFAILLACVPLSRPTSAHPDTESQVTIVRPTTSSATVPGVELPAGSPRPGA